MAKSSTTFGEFLFAVSAASVAGIFAAAFGFLAASFVSDQILSGEQAAWAPLRYGFPVAIALGATTFIWVFFWVKNYGRSK